jgi:pyruvate formate lyase activating enzyme
MTTGMIFDIKRYAINDGPGIRTAVFFKGCPLDCWWCHNPEGQSGKPQLMFRSNRCKSSRVCLQACPKEAITWNEGSVTNWDECDDCGKCAEVCFAGAREIIGQDMTINQLMTEIERDIPFYDQSVGGVTFTGGEPMQQREFLRDALLACKAQQIHTTVDTSGYTSWEKLSSILPLVDLFLYDVKLMNANKHIKFTSVSNRKILDNLHKLSSARAHIIVRIPLIPGINDDNENIKLCGSFLAALPHLDGIELMPYHEIGIAKYQALGMNYRLANTISPTNDQIGMVEELLSGYHLPVIKHLSGRTV